MSSPQQFVERFLRDKAAAYASARARLTEVYAGYFAEPLSQHAERFMPSETVTESVEDVRIRDDLALVIVGRRLRITSLRTRYRLAAVGEDWRIIGIDHECFRCQGTGKSGNGKCERCDREGWKELDRSEAL